jgi:hypothetical protein
MIFFLFIDCGRVTFDVFNRFNFHITIILMTLHFVQLTLGNKTYKIQVSTANCTYVDDFKVAIKNKLPNLLNGYDAAQLTLLQPDGTAEIDPETLVTDLKEIPWKPILVTVEELSVQPAGGTYKKQPGYKVYKGMSTEASCRKFLDALAAEIYYEYSFQTNYKKPTMGDVLAAKDGQFGNPENAAPGIRWWDYRKLNSTQITTIPLPNRLSVEQWDLLKALNRDTTNRIHDAQLPRTSSQKPFIVLPREKITKEKYVDTLRSIAAIIGVVSTEDDLIVKDELDTSGSSSSEFGSPDKEKRM